MKKRGILCLLLALLLAVSVIPMFGLGTAMATETPDSAPEPVRGVSQVYDPYADTLTIFHTNDTHGRIAGLSSAETKEGVTLLNAAKVAGKVAEMRAKGEHVLLLSAGDEIHGTLSATGYKGLSVITMMNFMGYDAMTVGNHEFDYGLDRLLRLEEYAHFPIFCANIDYEDGTDAFKCCGIRLVGDRKIGIFGLSTPETAVKAHPKYTTGLVFDDDAVYASAKEEVEYLESQGCDFIIALSHLGLDGSSAVRSELVAEQVPGIDLIIDGHSHTVLESGKQVGDTMIVSTGEYFQHLGKVTVKFTDDSFEVKAELLDSEDTENWPEDKNTARLLKGYTMYADNQAAKVVGTTAEVLDGARENVRTKQTNLGSLVTDSMRWLGDSDIAITNGGGIRATIDVGNITYANVLSVLPFGNTIVVKKMTGADVLTVLEEGVAAYPETAGGFMHVSGVAFTFDPAKPAGSRVISATVGGEAIDVDAIYTVTTNDFLAAGGDGSSLGKGEIYADMGVTMDAALQDYLTEFGCVYEAGERITVK